jgi:hypothetical protein
MNSISSSTTVVMLAALTMVRGAGPANAAPPIMPTPPPSIAEAPPTPSNIWVAVSRGYPHDAGSAADQIGGVGTGPDEHTAMIASLNNCASRGAGNCGYLGDTENRCIALAVAGDKDWATGIGPFIYRAQRNALAQNPGGHIVASGCAHNPPTVAKNPGPPATAARG